MAISQDLITQLARATNDKSKTSSETTVKGTIKYDGRMYVQIDGSDQLTPVSTTVNAEDGDRVTVLLKDHTATVTGNLTSPSANENDIHREIEKYDIIVVEQIQAESARIDSLVTENVTIQQNLKATSADIQKLQAEDVTINGKLDANEASIKKLDTEKLSATAADMKYATVESLDATNANVNNLSATHAEFKEATIKDLEAQNAVLKSLNTTYATIDFANINEAAVKKIFTESGIIKDLVVSEGHITGELVGVTIKGDLIEAGTLKADKLVVKGENGLYYKLNIEAGATTSEEVTKEDLQNGLSGSVLVAKSVTAEKISVNDLVAFGATIGGFQITNKSIYSGVKESVDNTTRGSYLDNEGQMAFGDDLNFLKYYKTSDEEGNEFYILEVSADMLKFASSGKDLDTAINEAEQNAYDRAIAQTGSDINNALSPYMTKDEFITSMNIEIDRLNGGVTAEFEKIRETVETLDGDTKSSFDKLYEWIKVDGGLTFGSSESSITLRIENDRIVFQKNGVTFGSWDGENFRTGNIYIDVNERAQFGNFAFIPRSNHSMSFLKVDGPDCINLVRSTGTPLIIPDTEDFVSYSEMITYRLSDVITNDPKAFLYSFKDGGALTLSFDINFREAYIDSSLDATSVGMYMSFRLTNVNGTSMSWHGHLSGNNTFTDKHTLSAFTSSTMEDLTDNVESYVGHCSCTTVPLEHRGLEDFFANPDNYEVTCNGLRVLFAGYTTGGTINNIQLERGVEDTGWAPAPEDILEVL